ncbi:MAG: pitrilysin family protein [Bacteroidales bacterium]|nr:pitrilysin family protein [Bacteroidales bacterium]
MIISSETTPLTFTLPNGIRVIHKQCQGEVSCCGFAVNTGTRHEQDFELGMAHFTEHLFFKGTTNRRAHHILNRMEHVGGELNAYTTKEETFVYSVFLQEDYERAIDLLSDLFFHSTFPQEEIDKERDVILDEINSYEDSPSELIFDDYEDLLFAGHPLGRRVLGNPACLEKFKNPSFVDFYLRNYTTDRIVFFSQSQLSLKKVKHLVDKYVGRVPANIRQGASVIGKPTLQHGVSKTLLKDTHQAHVIYGNKNYSLYEDKRVGMYLLNNILGGPGMNSRLNVSLREHSGLVYSVESNVTSYTDTGVFAIYFGTDLKQTERCLTLVEKELKKLREMKLTPIQLHAAKKQLYGQMMISSENKENQSLSMGKSMLHFNRYDSMEEVIRKIESFSPESLLDIANEVLDPLKMTLLIYK